VPSCTLLHLAPVPPLPGVREPRLNVLREPRLNVHPADALAGAVVHAPAPLTGFPPPGVREPCCNSANVRNRMTAERRTTGQRR